MQSSTSSQPTQGFFTRQKNKISHLAEGWRIELTIIGTMLFCISFWNQLPHFNINPLLGKGIAAVGILILFAIIAYKAKYSLMIGVASLAIYMGVNLVQGFTLKEITTNNPQEHNTTSFVNNNNTDLVFTPESK